MGIRYFFLCLDLDSGTKGEGLGTGMQDVKYRDTGHGDVNDYCKSQRSMQYLFLHENVLLGGQH